MQIFRPAAERGHVRAGWLDSRHSFSFGHYHDPQWMGWGPLRVINEDRVQPGAGFAPPGHANMEIISYVISGGLAHRDSGGNEGVLRPGELQWMSAGHGIEHSEYNASDSEPVHFLQIWIQPNRLNAAPASPQKPSHPPAPRPQGGRRAPPAGADGSRAIRQDARLFGVQLAAGESVASNLDPARRYWLQVVQGQVSVGERALSAGDAVGYADEAGELRITGAGETLADLLLFELPG